MSEGADSLSSPFESTGETLISATSLDKDALIDEMQEKIGKLLMVQQDFCNLKNQYEILKDTFESHEMRFNSERAAYQADVADLKRTIEEQRTELQEKENTINNLKAENLKLGTAVDHYSTKVAQMEEQLEQEVKEQVEAQTNELKKEISQKEEKISSLESEVENLNYSNQSKNESLVSSSVEIEKLNLEIENLQNENDEVNTKLKYSEKQVEELTQELKEVNEKIEVNSKQISDFHIQVNKLEHEVAEKDVEIGKLTNINNENKSKIDKILSIDEQHSSLDNVISHIITEHALIPRLESKLKSQTSKTKQLAKIVVEYESDNKKLQNKLKKMVSSYEELSENYKHSTQELEGYKSQSLKVKNKQLALKAINKANKQLYNDFSEISNVIIPGIGDLSLRTLINTIIFARRIKMPANTHELVSDNKNWWWIPTAHANQKSLIVNTYTNALMKCQKLEDQNQDLLNNIKSGQETILKANRIISEKEKQINVEQSKVAELQLQLQSATDTLNCMVEAEKYESVVDKLRKLKTKFSSSVKMLQEKEFVLSDIRDQYSELEAKYQKQSSNYKAIEIDSRQLRAQNDTLKDEVEILRQALMSKRKEVLSLERGIYSEQKTKAALVSQCCALASENQNMARSRAEISVKRECDDVALGARLRDMSRNMTGTLY